MNNMKQNQTNSSRSSKKGLEPMKYEIANEVGKRNTRSKAVKRSRTTKKNSSK